MTLGKLPRLSEIFQYMDKINMISTHACLEIIYAMSVAYLSVKK